MRKQQTLTGKLGKVRSKTRRRSSNDPRSKTNDTQVTNTDEQEEVVNEPYIKTDRQEETQNTPTNNEPPKPDPGTPENTDELKPEA